MTGPGSQICRLIVRLFLALGAVAVIVDLVRSCMDRSFGTVFHGGGKPGDAIINLAVIALAGIIASYNIRGVRRREAEGWGAYSITTETTREEWAYGMGGLIVLGGLFYYAGVEQSPPLMTSRFCLYFELMAYCGLGLWMGLWTSDQKCEGRVPLGPWTNFHPGTFYELYGILCAIGMAGPLIAILSLFGH